MDLRLLLLFEEQFDIKYRKVKPDCQYRIPQGLLLISGDHETISSGHVSLVLSGGRAAISAVKFDRAGWGTVSSQKKRRWTDRSLATESGEEVSGKTVVVG